MRMMMPQSVLDSRVAGVREMDSYTALRYLADDLIRGKGDNPIGGKAAGSDTKKATNLKQLAREIGEEMLGQFSKWNK